MTRYLSLLLLMLAVGMFAACGGDQKSGDADGDHGHEHDEGDDHDDHDGDDHEGDDHEGHEHDEGDDHDGHDDEDHGKLTALGKSKAGAFEVSLGVFGEIEAGHEAVLDIDVAGTAPAAVRAWVGIESGKGSMKTKIDGEKGEYHGHLEVGKTLPEGSAIWVEVESADGTKAATSFAIP
jgi:hypothetical protein